MKMPPSLEGGGEITGATREPWKPAGRGSLRLGELGVDDVVGGAAGGGGATAVAIAAGGGTTGLGTGVLVHGGTGGVEGLLQHLELRRHGGRVILLDRLRDLPPQFRGFELALDFKN